MVAVIIGIIYGALVGLFGNWLLFRKMAENKRQGIEPLKGIGLVFLIRYGLDLVSLLVFAYVTRHGPAIVAAVISLTIAVKVSLFIVYARKGGRFD